MTYGQFLAIFLGIPIAAMLVWGRRPTLQVVAVLLVLSIVALLYTAPWDNLLISSGVWTYGPHRVVGILIGHVPIEEYVFYLLQVLLTGLLTVALLVYSSRSS